MKLSETEKAYIAGIIDGEGSIEIHPYRQTKRGLSGQRGVAINQRITISNTSAELIDWLEKRLDFTLRTKKVLKYKTKTLHRIDITKRDAIKKLLTAIFPYLIVKHQLAELMLEYIKSRENHIIKDGYTDRELEIIEKMVRLNARTRKWLTYRLKKFELFKKMLKETRYKPLTKELIEQKYLLDGKTIYQIAEELKINPAKVYYWVKKYSLLSSQKGTAHISSD